MICSHDGSQFFSICDKCGELVVPPDIFTYQNKFFELFDFIPKYFIDPDTLQKKYYELSRKTHPDKFQNKSIKSMASATEWFALINQALKTLSDNLTRSGYLLMISNFKFEEANRSLPLDLAEDYFGLQEILSDDSIAPQERKSQYLNFLNKINEKIIESDRKREEEFKRWEEKGSRFDENAKFIFEKVSRQLGVRSYLSSMAADLEKKCQML